MVASRPAGTTPVKAPEKSWSKVDFIGLLAEFLKNKALAEYLKFINDGDKDTPGLKDRLLRDVKRHGERDPESGSFILGLEEPVAYGTKFITKVKAEARGAGAKILSVERTEDLLNIKGREDETDYIAQVTVERFTFGDLDHNQAAKVRALLGKLKVDFEEEILFDEEKLLALHFEDVLTEDELDAIYDPAEITWAFKPLA